MESWTLSWEGDVKGMFRLNHSSTAQNTSTVNTINHYYLDNHSFEQFMQIPEISPMFYDENDEAIGKLDHRFNTLSKKENIEFMIERMKECEIYPFAWSAESGITEDGQFDIFCKMAEIFINESNTYKYRQTAQKGVPKFVKFSIEPNHGLTPVVYPAGGELDTRHTIKEIQKRKLQLDKARIRKEKLHNQSFFTNYNTQF
jgi:hypothetical protein